MDYSHRAWKNKNAAAYVYYKQHQHYIAFNSYETFIDSWAGQEWLKKNQQQIQSLVEERARRFGERWVNL